MTAVDLLSIILPERPDQPTPALPLPLGTIRVQPLATPLPPAPTQTRAHARSLALATKASSLSDIAAQFTSAADRAQKTIECSRTEWTTWSNWRNSGEWRLEARGARRGAGLQSSANVQHLAKDVVAFYGLAEASPALRARSHAFLGKDGEVVVPRSSAGRRCLRVEVKLDDGGQSFVAFATADQGDNRLRRAQADVFDEELLVQLASEGRARSATVSGDAVSVSHVAGVTLSVSLVSESDASASSDPIASLVLCLLRLRLIALYRHRRSPGKSAAPAILAPILSFIVHFVRIRRVERQMAALVERWAASDLGEATATTRFLSSSGDAMRDLARQLAMAKGFDVSGSVSASLPAGSALSTIEIVISTSAPSPATLVLRNRRISLSSLGQFDTYLCAEATAALRSLLHVRAAADFAAWTWTVQGELLIGQLSTPGSSVARANVVFRTAFSFETGASIGVTVQQIVGDAVVPSELSIAPGPRMLQRCLDTIPPLAGPSDRPVVKLE